MSGMRWGLSALLLTLLCWASSASGADTPKSNSATNMPSTGGINAILGANRANTEPEFLPPDEAFRLEAFGDGPDRVRVQWAVHEGYYLYKSRIKVETSSTEAQLGKPVLPQGEQKEDEYFGKQEVYHQDVEAIVPVARAGGGAFELPIDVTYQGCADAGLCYPPITKSLKVSLGASGSGGSSASSGAVAAAKEAPVTGGGDASVEPSGAGSAGFVSEQDWLARLLQTGNIAVVLGTFFLIGIGLSFTPCVLPMIPILSGIIVGQGEKVTPTRGFSLAFTYVQGMAITYAITGAAFVLIFKQTAQTFFQKPWIVGLFAALFVALALAMFGLFTLQLPSALQTKLTDVSNKQKAGTYGGTFVMGALSALVVTACVAPALIAALSVISQTGQVGRGAGALYATGLGMGVPLLLVGASAGSLLPRVGPWMDTVKALFGVLFLGVAIYFIQRLIPPAAGMLLWSALAVTTGYWMFSLQGRDGRPAPAVVRAPGLLALVYGIILLIGVAAGAKDPLEPLSTLRGGRAAAASHELTFDTIKSVDDLQQRVAAASATGKPVMLDFYADWCVSCKEMEKYTFTDEAVKAALGNAVLLRADVTANDAIDQALLKHFGIFGPPTIAFYDATGNEQRRFRVVGYMKAREFEAVVRQAFGSAKST